MKTKIFMKSLAIMLSAANVLSAAVFAEAIQTGENSVRISGNVGKAEICDYTIDVYAPGKSFKDINTVSGSTNTDVLVYHNQHVTDENGNYDIEFDMVGVSGKYQVLVYSDSMGIDDSQILTFRSIGDFKTALDELNAIAKDETKTVDDFIKYINGNNDMLGFAFDDLKLTDEEKAFEIIYDYANETSLDTDNAEKVYKQACIISEINSGKIADVFEYSEYFSDDVKNLDKYLEKKDDNFVLTSSIKKGVTARLKEEKCSSISGFLDKLAEFVVLEVVITPNGVENFKKVLNDFEYATGLSGADYKTAELSAVIGESYDSIEDLKKALEDAKKKTPNSSLQSRPSAGSGGGGGSYSGGGGNVEVTKPTEEDDVDRKPIHDDIYIDIDGVEWAKNAIIGLTEKGIVNGKAIDVFAPDDCVTREEFAKILVVAFAKEATEADLSFSDVEKNSWYYTYVAKAVSAGLMNGYSENEFGTGDPISREDIATALWRAVYSERIEADFILEFSDADSISGYAVEAVKVLSKDKIINGMGDNRFCPKEKATRAQAAKMVYEILER